MADIDDAHERAMRRYDDFKYDAGLDADSEEAYAGRYSSREGFNADGEPY
jgi:hypothetical protein